MKDLLTRTKGDATGGVAVFKKLCAQCHKIYGEGQDVGPDLTNDGRANFDLLLSNVFDPSLVIGASYQATNVVTTQGRSLTGLLVEDSPQRVVLKLQGGKLETIPRGDVDIAVGQQGVADAGGRGEAAEAAGDRRPVRVPDAGQAAGRPGGAEDTRDAEPEVAAT